MKQAVAGYVITIYAKFRGTNKSKAAERSANCSPRNHIAKHNKPNTIMKLISYMVTCGGDAGFRFSNQPEWCSVGTMLLFDAEKWDVEKIYNVMKDLYRQYRNAGNGWTLSAKIDLGKSAVKPFINNNDGVYVDLDYRDEDGICWLGTLGVDQEKQIHSKEHDVTRWSRNGDTRNFDYYK